MGDSAVAVIVVYPDLLGTYGDGGNAVILAQRLRWRGMAADVVEVPLGTPLPESGDLYLLGGGEDAPQALAARELRARGVLAGAVGRGAVLLAVCAGVQVAGTRFLTADGVCDGVGLVDNETLRGLPRRAVGELVVNPDPTLDLPVLSGYENHAGMTRLGPGLPPLGRVRVGMGNGTDDRVDGFVVPGRMLGTYLHGPVLARNPQVADLLLGWAVGDHPAADPELAEADGEAADLRSERLVAALAAARRSRWARLVRRRR